MQLLAKNVSIGYANHVLFDAIDINLEAEKLTCLMAPNGVGKSTLIKTLAGILPPLAGELPKLNAKTMALVLTDKITAMNMTVYDLVSYGRYPHTDWKISFSEYDHHVVEQSIGEVNMQSLARKKLEELSDGQLQLAMIARALAQETPLILLDEPTVHLDLNNRLEIMRLLKNLAHKKKKTILVALHELDLGLQLADVVWLAAHKKIKVGIPEDLVLGHVFDEIFQFKGFDLKTGKIKHESFRKQKINLIGNGHEFLWTKNALEREGYSLAQDGKTLEIQPGAITPWKFAGLNFNSLEELIKKVNAEEHEMQ